jgi:hypothetical protein
MVHEHVMLQAGGKEFREKLVELKRWMRSLSGRPGVTLIESSLQLEIRIHVALLQQRLISFKMSLTPETGEYL